MLFDVSFIFRQDSFSRNARISLFAPLVTERVLHDEVVDASFSAVTNNEQCMVHLELVDGEAAADRPADFLTRTLVVDDTACIISEYL